MNYSDYDSDGYSSNEDADYIPSDDNLSEDDLNECEKEDPLREDDDVPHPDDVSKKKRKKKDISMRKRKIRVLKIETEERDGAGAEEAQPPQEELVKPTEVEVDDEAKQKKKSDDLWASFLSDVGSRPKESTPTSQSSTEQKVSPVSADTKAPEPATVTITKVFDFAGEEVRYESSAQFETVYGNPSAPAVCVSSSGCVLSCVCSAKRSAGVSGVLSRIGGKKQKMSTLEKSKMDWDAFKSEEGITEELAIHNRGREGYVERKNFLERVDHRQFELEKAVRLNNMK
uniref:Craniofacial development protein 1 n=1 Tax=Seriola lalandi dorsalis TaxID=1841481 RepID=A0A3B4WG62_SERLL